MHQKIFVVNGKYGLIAFCGSMDIDVGRFSTEDNRFGLHEVQCEIRGPGAHRLLNVFEERWRDHPQSKRIDAEQGPLVSLNAPPARQEQPLPHGRHYVQVARTYANGQTNLIGVRENPKIRQRPYDFAPTGEQSIKAMVLHAIEQARRFIYLEDQYVTSMEISAALVAALPHIRHLIVVMPDGSIFPLQAPVVMPGNESQTEYRRHRFLEPLRRAAPEKVHVCLRKFSAPHNYIHSKLWVFDDEFAIIGSANCNRRSFTHDSEAAVGIADQSVHDDGCWHFAHRLRVALWAEHLNMETPEGYAELADGVAAAAHWISPPPGALVEPYVETGPIEPRSDLLWDQIDPDGS